MLEKKITVTFDASILTPVAVVTKEPKKQFTAVISCNQIHDWIEEKSYESKPFRPLDSKEKGA